jgi:DNA-binding MarR family transcriptional regulator
MEPPPGPTPHERFRRAYWRAIRELDTVRLLQWEHSHLTLPQLRVLFQVQRCPGATTGRLSRTMGITMSTTSGLVAKLVDAGLLVRGKGSEDRRQIPLELTDRGRALAGDLAEFSRPFLERLSTELGGELESVISALDRLSDAAAAVRREEVTEDENGC